MGDSTSLHLLSCTDCTSVQPRYAEAYAAPTKRTSRACTAAGGRCKAVQAHLDVLQGLSMWLLLLLLSGPLGIAGASCAASCPVQVGPHVFECAAARGLSKGLPALAVGVVSRHEHAASLGEHSRVVVPAGKHFAAHTVQLRLPENRNLEQQIRTAHCQQNQSLMSA